MSPAPQDARDTLEGIPQGDVLLSRVRQALRTHDEAQAGIGQKSADLARVRKDVEDAKAGRSKLTQSFSAKAAAALAAGEEMPDPSERDLRSIKKFNQTIAAAQSRGLPNRCAVEPRRVADWDRRRLHRPSASGPPAASRAR